MCTSCRTSGTNCARIYNSSGERKQMASLLPIGYSTRLKLDVELVWNTMFLYWLFEYHRNNDLTLELDHRASSQAKRLSKALEKRNHRTAGTGQPEWNHACKACCWIKEDESTGGQYPCTLFSHSSI